MPKVGYKQSLNHKNKHLEKIKGNKNGSWKGGIWAFDKTSYKRIQNRIREYRTRNLTKGTFTHGEWETLKKQYGYTCPSCNISEPKITLTIDHIIPLIKGGTNFIENVQPLCRSCNSKKSTKIIYYH